MKIYIFIFFIVILTSCGKYPPDTMFINWSERIIREETQEMFEYCLEYRDTKSGDDKITCTYEDYNNDK